MVGNKTVTFVKGIYEGCDLKSQNYSRVDTWINPEGRLAFMQHNDGTSDLDRAIVYIDTRSDDRVVIGEGIDMKRGVGYPTKSELEILRKRIENLERAQENNELKTGSGLGYDFYGRIEEINKGRREGDKDLSIAEIDALLEAAFGGSK